MFVWVADDFSLWCVVVPFLRSTVASGVSVEQSIVGKVDKALVLRPGDIVVVEFDQYITVEQAQEVKEHFSKFDVRAIALGKGVRLARETVEADGD